MMSEPHEGEKIGFGPKVALVVVDVQNDFAHPDGSLYVDGGAEVVRVVNELIGRAKYARSFIVYTQDWHPAETPHFANFGGVWPSHCVRDTWGAELCDNLLVDGPIVRKGTGGEDGYSGFSMRDPVSGETSVTELNTLLAERSIERVVVVGLALDVCVMATATDALANGYSVVVPPEASAAVNLSPGDGDKAISDMTAQGISLG